MIRKVIDKEILEEQLEDKSVAVDTFSPHKVANLAINDVRNDLIIKVANLTLNDVGNNPMNKVKNLTINNAGNYSNIANAIVVQVQLVGINQDSKLQSKRENIETSQPPFYLTPSGAKTLDTKTPATDSSAHKGKSRKNYIP